MPTLIILTSVISSWTPFWAILASGIVAVIAISALLAAVTSPRRHRRRRTGAAESPRRDQTPADVDTARQHALV
ncbi:MAG: hypothetical protein ACLQFR_24425 [Streptosporangiaceae bacterium]